MKKATQSEERSGRRNADSIHSALHTLALHCLISLLITLVVLGCTWLVEVLT
ncbi:hypothetical protein ACM7VQ_03480 [Pseudomonas aeruginosa]|uniref:hypothetical protein n=1 Tax=Pseudomonas aeruginosa TaxID=287 RepID=UPI0003BAE9A1|nr:hypothetical protein [Pseudomonas aeruginosa]EKV8015118.1 hypothetical protein [Pseudomonas aeruginosa]ERX72392.1 hypothetical protein P997_05010 [Pseudomonas aeruginosa 62]ETV28002.1 hypothetical protein Q047_01606 [Pseudomonas aeruginosa BWHPSA042]MBG5800569.1 hypothetical protein [Pseudomonas aeruginosa]MBH3513568.1 hypothetical protein [Pseudomonas aeruginosa]